MKSLLNLLLLAASCLASPQRPNILFIAIDDLRPELKCFGVDYIHSPNIDRLASQGRIFSRHYVQAPTCGASRYTLLTGRYGPWGNQSLFERGKKLMKDETLPPSLPAWFRQHGYTTVSVGKISHHPGGRGGKNWDDANKLEMPHSWHRHLMPTGPWKHPRGAMHGLADGETRAKITQGDMAVFQSFEGPDTSYPDGLILNEALTQLDQLTESKAPFFLAVGFIRPHLPFGAPAKYMEPYHNAKLSPTPHPTKPPGRTTWHKSGEFRNQYTTWGKEPNTDPEFALELRKHYAACVTYVDHLVGQLLESLERSGAATNTIIALWGDHGWHLGEHAIWGKHALFEESLHSPLIITAPGMQNTGEATNAIVETIDIYPTLCELAHLPTPNTLHGTSLKAQLEDPNTAGRHAISYKGETHTIRTNDYRLILHKDGYAELYDVNGSAQKNLAKEQPDKVKELSEILKSRVLDKRP